MVFNINGARAWGGIAVSLDTALLTAQPLAGFPWSREPWSSMKSSPCPGRSSSPGEAGTSAAERHSALCCSPDGCAGVCPLLRLKKKSRVLEIMPIFSCLAALQSCVVILTLMSPAPRQAPMWLCNNQMKHLLNWGLPPFPPVTQQIHFSFKSGAF